MKTNETVSMHGVPFRSSRREDSRGRNQGSCCKTIDRKRDISQPQETKHRRSPVQGGTLALDIDAPPSTGFSGSGDGTEEWEVEWEGPSRTDALQGTDWFLDPPLERVPSTSGKSFK